MVEQIQQNSLDDETPRQGHDERRQFQAHDEKTPDKSDDGAGRQRRRHGGPPRPAVLVIRKDRGDGTAHAGNPAEREVNLAEHEQPDLGHTEQHIGHRLNKQVRDVVGGQKYGAADLEVDHEHHEGDQDGHDAYVRANQPSEAISRLRWSEDRRMTLFFGVRCR